MSQSDIEKIKERLGIKELVESYIKLEKAGKNYKGRCPFHNEKTPSFFVSPDRDNYYCFGCGAKGDIFTFVEQFEGVEFSSALRTLADKTGVKIKNYSKEAETRIQRMKDILELSTKYFEFNLKNNPEVREYLKKRGLKDKTIKEWRIGFAPNGWHNLEKFLLSKKYTKDEIEKTGMLKKGDKENYYDTFRNRITFPIANAGGQVVAFTGRIFGPDDEIAKYLNSPETELFRKSEILYGFDQAKKAIRKNDFAILVEGQTDTLMCHQAGYLNTVASSGTALTNKQLEIIYRISPKMVIAYDSDSAGFKASEKAWQMALSLGIDVKIAPIPEGNDPADIIRKDPKKWKEIIKNSRHIIDALIEKIQKEQTDDREIGKAVSKEIIPYLKMIDSKIDRAHFVKLINSNFNIPEDAIYGDLENSPQPTVHSTQRERENSNVANETRDKDEFAIEKRLLGLVAWQEKSKNKIFDSKEVEEEIKKVVGAEYENIERTVSDFIEDLIFTLENNYDNDKVVQRDVKELLVNLKLKYLVRQREELLLSLRTAEESNDEKEADELLKKISEISKEIQNLNSRE